MSCVVGEHGPLETAEIAAILRVVQPLGKPCLVRTLTQTAAHSPLTAPLSLGEVCPIQAEL